MNSDVNINIINNIRSLGIDMISAAGSGHPGIVLGAAPILYALVKDHYIYSTADPNWINRDRFVMASGHGSALLYATLYMMGYLTLDDLKQYRQYGSKTTGHPESSVSGIDITTGPLGEGFASAVGMALAGKKLKEQFKIENESLYNYNVYALCGDGELMEGISYEAASLAGLWKLDNLIVLYDSNDISLDGPTSLAFNDNIEQRFNALNWDYMLVKDGNNYKEISKAIEKAKGNSKPTIIEVKTVIGLGSKDQGTNIVHGKPLEENDIRMIKDSYGFPDEKYFVIDNIDLYFQKEVSNRINQAYSNWSNIYQKYIAANGEDKLLSFYHRDNPINLNTNEFQIGKEDKISTREFNSEVISFISRNVNNFIGGAADLFTSTNTYTKDQGTFGVNNYNGKNIYFGVREHAMGGILNGLALCGYKPYGATFLVFADFLKPALRLSALMSLPVTYIFSHDNILIGPDGPTHMPVEQLSMLRNTPNMTVYRPADPNELIGCWNEIIKTTDHPSSLILSKLQNIPLKTTNKNEVFHGAYTVREAKNLMGIIIATGTEVYTAIHVADKLFNEYKLDLRVVSMPSKELFEKQPQEYQKSILPDGTRTFVIEFASSNDWYKYVYNEKYLITINTFGASGSKNDVEKAYKIDVESISNHIKDIML